MTKEVPKNIEKGVSNFISNQNSGIELASIMRSHPLCGMVKGEDGEPVALTLSDHHPQTLTLSIAKSAHIKVITWNIQRKCIERTARKDYANNPINLEETEVMYQARLAVQMEEIAILAVDGVAMLQEGDDVEDRFLMKMKEGEKFGVFPENKGKHDAAYGGYSGFIFVYDKSIYTPVSIAFGVKNSFTSLIGTDVVKSKIHGATPPKHTIKSSFCILRHETLNRNILFVSVHAGYKIEDVRVVQWLKDVKNVAASRGMSVVIGGDFNRPLHRKEFSAHFPLITGIATNIAPKVDENAKPIYYLGLTCEHEHTVYCEAGEGPKTYDGFFVDGVEFERAEVRGEGFYIEDGRLKVGSTAAAFNEKLELIAAC